MKRLRPYLIALGVALVYLGVLGLLQERDDRIAHLEMAWACDIPKDKQMLHMATDPRTGEYVCSYTRFKNGMWGVSRVERRKI